MVSSGQDETTPNDGRPARAAAVTLAVALVVLTAGLGYVDGTGLFAPLNWVDTGFFPTFATSPAWGTVVFLPLLVAGGALLCHRALRSLTPGTPGRWAFWGAWSALVLAAFGAKLVYTLLLLVIAGPHGLHVWPTVGAVLAACGLSAAKYGFFGLLAAGPAAAAYSISAWRGRRRAGGGERTATDPPAGAPAPLWSPVLFVLGAIVADKAAETIFGWVAVDTGFPRSSEWSAPSS
ncbi:hypothetical protein ACFQX7_38850 [Luedemannella flava]